MLIDNPNVVEGSVITNPTVPSGSTLPSANLNVGELFYKTTAPIGLHVYNGTAWQQVLDSAHVNDQALHLTTAQNTLLDNIPGTVTGTEIGYVDGVTSGIQGQLNGKVSKAGDTLDSGASLTFQGGGTITGLPDTPTGASDATSQHYVDASDYLNFDPKVGVLGENTVPIGSDFKYAINQRGTPVHTWVDSSGKNVSFFNARSALQVSQVFRAYRYSDDGDYIFDNDPVSASWLVGAEYISYIWNMGTYFAVLDVRTDDNTRSRLVVVRTNESSRWQDWTLYADITSLISTNSNFFVVFDSVNGDRIMRLTQGNSLMTLDVYSFSAPSTFNLLRSQTIYDQSTDTTNIDQQVGRTAVNPGYTRVHQAPNASLGLAFFPPYLAGTLPTFGNAFTWNAATQKLLLKCAVNYTYSIVETRVSPADTIVIDGSVIQRGAVTFNWTIPRTWLQTGAGTPVNNIPLKPSGFRYHKLQDDTWDTDTGGLGMWAANRPGFNTSQTTSITTDEYTGKIYLNVKGSDDNNSFDVNRFPVPTSAVTLSGPTFEGTIENPPLNTGGRVIVPDASPWGKSVRAFTMQLVDRTVLFQGRSASQGGGTSIATQNVSTSFQSTYDTEGTNTSNTLRLNIANYRIESTDANVPADVRNNFVAGYFGTTALSGGAARAFWARPGSPVYNITVSGGARSYSLAGITMPALPASIGTATIGGAISPASFNGNITVAWNGLVGASAVFWVTVAATTDTAYGANRNNSMRIARWSGSTSTWSLSAPLFTAVQDSFKTARGENVATAPDNWRVAGHICLAEDGELLIPFSVQTTTSATTHVSRINSVTLGEVSVATLASQFPQDATIYDSYATTGSRGETFGYSSGYGYYLAIGSQDETNIMIVSSRNDATGTSITKAQWFDGTGARTFKYLTAQSTIGLFAYFSQYPIFLGGYYSTIPSDQPLALVANTTNYIYAEREAGDRTGIRLFTETVQRPNTFNRVLLAAVVTNSQNIVSSTSYPVGADAAALQTQVDGKVSKAGDSMTGPLLLSSTAHTANNEAVSKRWTEQEIEKSVPFGSAGQVPFIEVEGTRDTEQDYIVKVGQFVESANELTVAQTRIIDFSTIFNTWQRFSHLTNYNVVASKTGNVVTFVGPTELAQGFAVGDSGLRLQSFTASGYSTTNATVTSETLITNLVKFTYTISPTLATPDGIQAITASRSGTTLTVALTSGTVAGLGLAVGSRIALVDMSTPGVNGIYLIQTVPTTTTFTVTTAGSGTLSGVTGDLYFRAGVLEMDNMQPAMPQELLSWSYNPAGYVESTVNSASVIGFISDRRYSDYVHEVELTSTGTDDDGIGVMLAWNVDGTGRQHTLIAWRSPGGNAPWRVTYDTGRSSIIDLYNGTQYVVWGNGGTGANATAAGYVTNNGSGWTTAAPNPTPGIQRSCRIKVTRVGDVFTVQTSNLQQIGTPFTGYLTGSAVATIDLNSQTYLQQFKGPKSYGYTAVSQTSSRFTIVDFSDNQNSIYRTDNNRVYEYTGGTWVLQPSTTTLQSEVGVGRLLFDEYNNKLFWSDSSGTVKKLTGFEDLPLYRVITSADGTVVDTSELANGRFYRVDSIGASLTMRLTATPAIGTVFIIDNNQASSITVSGSGATVYSASSGTSGAQTVSGFNRVICHKVDATVWKISFSGAGAGGGTTTNALTFNNGGAGGASGSTFNGGTAVTVSYNTIGAAPLASPSFTGQVKLPDGTLAAPALTFTSDAGLNSGIYRSAENTWHLTAGAAAIANISTTGFDVLARLRTSGNISSTSWTTTGAAFDMAAATFTDTSSTSVTVRAAGTFNRPTFSSPAASTVTNAVTLYVANSPAVAGSLTATNSYAFLVDAGNSRFDSQIFTSSGTSAAPAIAFTSDTNTGIYLQAADTVGIAGSLYATGNVTAYSDARVKVDLEFITGALNRVDQLNGYTYVRSDLEDKRRTAGVIAQEVEAVLPEVVHTSDDGMKAVNYNGLTALLIEAVKELKAEVEALKAEITLLKG